MFILNTTGPIMHVYEYSYPARTSLVTVFNHADGIVTNHSSPWSKIPYASQYVDRNTPWVKFISGNVKICNSDNTFLIYVMLNNSAYDWKTHF